MVKPAAKKAPAKKAPAKNVAAGAAAKTASTTVTLRQLAASIAETHEMTKKQAEAVLGDTIDMMVKHLKKGARVRVAGLGILSVRKRAARMGRNPATGEAIKIKASKKVAFRAAKELKEAI
ncbi:MAG: HU family DNA-binding protein [Beijerinckiaceae bacterium]